LIITLVIVAILAPIVLLTAFFALEAFAGMSALRSSFAADGPAKGVVVIPAHDEEAVIGCTVGDLVREAGKHVPILVVADNCTDGTAAAARAAGATVVVRDDRERRGKGFALAAAREHLRADPPDVVIVLDADCRLDGLSALAPAAVASARPCQAVNLLAPDLTAPPLVQISTFAFMIKNLVRQRGLQRLAGRVHLTGTGMALPWPIFEGANLGGANIVEDLALGLELAERAKPAMLVEEATVWSPAASEGGTLVQRRRWEGGYIATALNTAPRLLASSIGRADLKGLWGALDLCVPPLALLFVLNFLAFIAALAGAIIGASIWPLLAQAAVGLLALAAVALAWVREGRRFASGATLLRLPMYVLWKLPLYLGLARRGAPKEWLRSGR
jgi:cellulose synthase/poly-beta-1,6-N-acetylglucosamine synthase-like glycosyltransferase